MLSHVGHAISLESHLPHMIKRQLIFEQTYNASSYAAIYPHIQHVIFLTISLSSASSRRIRFNSSSRDAFRIRMDFAMNSEKFLGFIDFLFTIKKQDQILTFLIY